MEEVSYGMDNDFLVNIEDKKHIEEFTGGCEYFKESVSSWWSW